jgi:hypothetical protein
MTNILLLPDEILRKIICILPINLFMMVNTSCSQLYYLKLNKLLLPWGIEGICTKDETLSPYTRRRYARMDRQRGVLYCMYDLIGQLAIIIGDCARWDQYNVNQHDYVYLMLRASQNQWYSITTPLRINERARLKLDSIPPVFHRDIMKSWTLRALL